MARGGKRRRMERNDGTSIEDLGEESKQNGGDLKSKKR